MCTTSNLHQSPSLSCSPPRARRCFPRRFWHFALRHHFADELLGRRAQPPSCLPAPPPCTSSSSQLHPPFAAFANTPGWRCRTSIEYSRGRRKCLHPYLGCWGIAIDREAPGVSPYAQLSSHMLSCQPICSVISPYAQLFPCRNRKGHAPVRPGP